MKNLIKPFFWGCIAITTISLSAKPYSYTALLLTKHSNKIDWQIYFKMGHTTTIFEGITGESSKDELIDNAKRLIIQELPSYKEEDLHLVFEKRDEPKKQATLVFYSPHFEEREVTKSSWMKISSIKVKNEVYYGNINKSTGLRSFSGTITSGLYNYLTASKAKVLSDAIKNAEKGTYLDQKKNINQPQEESLRWPTEGNVILFYKENIKPPHQARDYFEFTNTYLHPMIIPDETGIDPLTNKSVIWPATEYYFQSMKFTDPLGVFTTILKGLDVGTLQKTIPTIKNPQKDPAGWKAGKNVETMLHALRAKFSQNGECKDSSQSDDQKLRTLLLSTGDAILIEDSGQGSHNDKIWGAGDDYSGFNYLGQLLMHIRHELKTGKAYLFIKADGPQFYKGVSITPDPNAPQWYVDRLAKLAISTQKSPKGPGKTMPLIALEELTRALKALA